MKMSELDAYLAEAEAHDDEGSGDTLQVTRLLVAAAKHEQAMRLQERARGEIHAVQEELAALMGQGMSYEEAVNYRQGRDAAASALAAVTARYHKLLDATLEQASRDIGAYPWLASAEMRKQTGVKETKASPLEVKMDEGTARFSGLASPFGGTPDSAGDIVEPGAYRATLGEAQARGQKYLYPVLWQHDTAQPLGGVLTAVERPDGLHVEGQIATDTDLGKYAYSLLQKRMVSGLSIGYIARKDRYVGAVRHLLAINLLEISLVTLPAAPLARITSL